MSPDPVQTDPPKPQVVVPFRRTAMVLGVLYLVVHFGLGQGLTALFVALLGVAMLLMGGLVALLRRRRPMALNRLLRAGIYLGLGLLSALTNRFQLAVSHRRAEQIVAACQRYRAERGVYPNQLEDLVPGFLPAVPPANVALMPTSFHYSFRPKEPDAVPWLWYHDFPGGARISYNFGTGRWMHFI